MRFGAQPVRNRKVMVQPTHSVQDEGEEIATTGIGGCTMGFSDNLCHLRSERNMTQEQLAMLMGVSRQAISKWESGRAYPEMDKLVRLCGIFECDLNELVRGDLSGRAVRLELAVPVDAGPVDVCGYDRHMCSRAAMLACALGVSLLSFAVFFGVSPAMLASAFPGARTVSELVVQFLKACTYGLPVLVVGLLVGLAIASVAVYKHLGFCGRFPYVESFYSDEPRKQTEELARRARVIAVVTAVAGIVACAVKSGPLCHVSGGLCSLFAWGGVSVWSLTYAWLMKARLNVTRHNERGEATAEQRVAARARVMQSNTQAVFAADPEAPRLASVWIRRQAAFVSLAVFAGFALVGAVFTLLGWPIFFIPFIVGAVAAVLIWAFLPCVL